MRLAAAELAEVRRLSNYTRYSSIARLKALSFGYGVLAPNIRALADATYIAGLRKAQGRRAGGMTARFAGGAVSLYVSKQRRGR